MVLTNRLVHPGRMGPQPPDWAAHPPDDPNNTFVWCPVRPLFCPLCTWWARPLLAGMRLGGEPNMHVPVAPPSLARGACPRCRCLGANQGRQEAEPSPPDSICGSQTSSHDCNAVVPGRGPSGSGSGSIAIDRSSRLYEVSRSVRLRVALSTCFNLL